MLWLKFNIGYFDLKFNFKKKLVLLWFFILIFFKIYLIYLGDVFVVLINVFFFRVMLIFNKIFEFK